MKMTTKLPDMHLVCENRCLYRPAFNHVEITKDDIVATNGNVFVNHKAKDVFSLNFIEEMPDKFYLHHSHWRSLSKKCHAITFEEGLIVQYFEGYRNYYKPIINPDWTYPKWESIIPIKDKRKPIDHIGLNPRHFNIVSKSLLTSSQYRVELSFFSILDGILITVPDCSSIAIIMPSILDC